MKTMLVAAISACCLTAPAAGASPFSWLSLGREKSTPARTAEVSSTTSSPHVLAKMTDGTKRLATNTKSLFMPNKPPAKKHGTVNTRRYEAAQPPKQSLFKRWFAPEPPPPPRTVDEWMSLEQIRP